jgi:hypothetical protein
MRLVYDNLCHQLDPAALRGLDDPNEHNFIGDDIAMSHHPTEGLLDRKVSHAASHMLEEPIIGNRVPCGTLIFKLDLMFRGWIAWPLRYHMVSNREQVAERKPGTDPDVDLGGGFVHKGRRQIYVTQLHLSSSCVHDRYAETPIPVNEEHGHAELGLIHVAVAIAAALALRSPKPLRYNGTTSPNSVVENPGVSILRTNGRTEMRRGNKDRIGAIPITNRLDRPY